MRERERTRKGRKLLLFSLLLKSLRGKLVDHSKVEGLKIDLADHERVGRGVNKGDGNK